jgi:S-adenosylmethionine-diacylgycerolhomoserine-N-methlytransferase
MNLKNDLLVLKSLIKPRRASKSADFLEEFYSDQADVYDEFRARLLKGRREMIQMIDWSSVSSWVDLGAGTGANLECVPQVENLAQIHLVDLSPSLLGVAGDRVHKMALKNVQLHKADACSFDEVKKVDLVTFSYSLTMIPDWFKAIENAHRLLKPGGTIAVVDFFVGRKWPQGLSGQHGFLSRTLWPIWFSYDNVFLNPDHLPYLNSKFEPLICEERQSTLPYLPSLLKVPYYIFIGQK